MSTIPSIVERSRRGAARRGAPGGTPLSSLTTYISVPVGIADGVRYAVARRAPEGEISYSGIGEAVEDEHVEKSVGRVRFRVQVNVYAYLSR